MHNIKPSSVHSQYRDSRGTGIPAAPQGRCMGAQDTAVPCYQSLQSSSSRDIIIWSRRGTHTSEVWFPHAGFTAPSLCWARGVPGCPWLQQPLRRRWQLRGQTSAPSPQEKIQASGCRGKNCWFATENGKMAHRPKENWMNWPGS